MPTGIPRQATPDKIARNGHIAAALRGYMKKHKLSAGDLNQRLGRSRGHTGLYQWMGAHGAPVPEMAARISEITGIALADLTPRVIDEVNGESHALVRVDVPRPTPTPRPAGDVLRFSVAANGDTRVQLDVTLHYSKGMPLVRMLMDAGIVLFEGEPTA